MQDCHSKTFNDMDASEFMNPHSAGASDDDSCITQFIEIVPLERDPDDPFTTECDIGDWFDEVDQEILQQIKQEPEDVTVRVNLNLNLTCQYQKIKLYLIYFNII